MRFKSLRLLVFTAILVSPFAHAQQELGLTSDRILTVLAANPYFKDAKLEPHPEAGTRGFVIAATEPAGQPPMTVELYGDKEKVSGIAVRYNPRTMDVGVFAAFGELIRLAMPEFGPPPASAAKSITGDDIPEPFRWPFQFQDELRQLAGTFTTPYLLRRAGSRFILLIHATDSETTALIGHGAIADPQGAHPPVEPAVGQILIRTEAGHYDEGLARLRALADGGNADAQAWLAESLFLRRGVGLVLKQEEADARDKAIMAAFESSAAKGNAHAQFWLGRLSRLGYAGLKPEAAPEWFRKAAIQGHAGAQFERAMTLLSGESADEADSTNWFEIAALQGNWGGMIGIAEQLRKGHGRAVDTKRAYFWYRVFETRFPRFADVNPASMMGMSDKVADTLEAAEKAEIEREVGQWKPLAWSEIRRACGRISCPKDLARP